MTEEHDENMKLWRSVEIVDPRHTKKFNVGRFGGTSVNPMSLIELVTKTWGPVGDKWGHTLISKEIVNGPIYGDPPQPEQVVVMNVRVWHAPEGCGASSGVSHWGSSKMLHWVQKGSYWSFNTEAHKMAYTNALKKTLSHFGFAAGIWKGYYDSDEFLRSSEAEFVQADESKRLANQLKLLDKRMDSVNGLGCTTDDERDSVLSWLGLRITYQDLADNMTTYEPAQVSQLLQDRINDLGMRWVDVLPKIREERSSGASI